MERAPQRIVAAVLCQPVGHNSKFPDSMYDSGHDIWGPELCDRRTEVTMEIVDAYLHNLYRVDSDFVYSVSRDFVRSCQTPMLVMPDDTPSHSYEAAISPKTNMTFPASAETIIGIISMVARRNPWVAANRIFMVIPAFPLGYCANISGKVKVWHFLEKHCERLHTW